MTDVADERAAAIHAVDSACPRCGAERAPEQRYCVDCGEPLPPASGRLPALRRRWVRRFGWYPGDWIWLPLATLVVAAAGAAAAVAVAHHRRAGPAAVITALGSVPVVTGAVVAATAPVTTGLPTPPEPTTAATPAGAAVWPAGTTGWTIVLVSYPKTLGRATPVRTAREAAKDGLPDVGVLDSSRYASLQPGYFVVWSGVYDSQAEANAAVQSAHQAGFGAAYSRRIAG